MGKYELKATEENLITTMENDILNRNKDLVYFINLLQSKIVSGIISLDGNWGSGKTFFVKQAMMVFNYNNPNYSGNSNYKERIDNIFSKNTKVRSDIFVVYYDAWKNDLYGDPISSIVYEVAKQIGVKFNYKNEKLYRIAASIIDSISKLNLSYLIECLEVENPITKFNNQLDICEQTKNFFTEVLEERADRLVIIIDELDRCNPNFAVKLLEQIKHYAEDDRVVFVASVNNSELQHTIKHHYGESFDACRYLDKFFSYNITLPPADTSKLFSKMGLMNQYIVEDVCQIIINNYHMELRDMDHFISQVTLAVYNPTHSNKWRFVFSEEEGEFLVLLYIVPLIIGLNIVDKTLFMEFVNGNNYLPLFELMSSKHNGDYVLASLKEKDESFVNEQGKKLVSKEEIIKRWYEAIFATDYSGKKYNTVLGDKYEYNSKSKKLALSAASLLSDYTDFNN